MANDTEAFHFSPKSSPRKTLDSPQMSPNKRLRTLNSPPSSSSKGKDKIDEFKLDSDPNCCGICLSEDGTAIRGWIDSCDHYFCFVCIMEWARVESRCPMCKGRFGIIRRPAKDGVFLSDRVVNVPVRDQVYHHFGNATMGPHDPYSQVQCTVCNSSKDENLLLLCDLCDTASHTYCVGLGATVPEGDWFCHDCTVSRAEHAKSEIDTNFDTQSNFSDVHKLPQADKHVSIYDIVRESSTERPSGTDLGARTLRRCRNVHGRIRALRENWNGFRSGSLSFSSGSVASVGSSNQERNVKAAPFQISVLPQESCSSQQTIAQREFSSDVLRGKSSHEIDKAWKMMDQARAKIKTVPHASKHPSSKISACKEKGYMSSKPLISNSKPHGTKGIGSSGSKKYTHHSSEKGVDGCKSLVFGKQKQSTATIKRTSNFSEGFQTNHLQGYNELPSSRNVRTSTRVDVCRGNDRKISELKFFGASRDALNGHDGSTCLISPVGSVPVSSDIVCARRTEPQEGKAMKEKSCVDSKTKRDDDDDAKSEIRSLVKLNLKLLGADKTLGVDTFKEIARLSTHSIMAACGLEHPKRGVRSFSRSVCHHTGKVEELRKSTLMPNSCRECFYVFVKDVVNTIMLEKVSSVGTSY